MGSKGFQPLHAGTATAASLVPAVVAGPGLAVIQAKLQAFSQNFALVQGHERRFDTHRLVIGDAAYRVHFLHKFGPAVRIDGVIAAVGAIPDSPSPHSYRVTGGQGQQNHEIGRASWRERVEME